MTRAMNRCLAGVLLIVVGDYLLNSSTQRMKGVISPPPPAVTSELPQDPEDRAQEPVISKQIDDTLAWVQWARLMQLAGVIVIAWPLLVWAMRIAVRCHAKQEVNHGQTDDPVPGGCGADLGRCHRDDAEHASREGSHQPATTGNHEGITPPPVGGSQRTGEPAAAG